ncbi:lipoate--protein ligase family protein [Bacteroides sp.]|uniref:lipoate--protein ligase family protein n=1 Tax=Bacteroides sp. TaxID=29523 RepID=UPI0026114DCD|nr:lipoate--protein ligase family protein [Bacteroides sp.]
MLCIDNRCTDIYWNLAAEEYLLKQKKDNYFMLWQSDPCVVIGKHQNVQAEVDEHYLQEKGISLARRFSGGGAVYHDMGNINLSFIETVNQPDFEYYLQQTIDFLDQMGVTAYSDKRMGIYVDGRKISGSAQCIHKNRVMYHCTLLFSTDLEVLNASLRGNSDSENLLPGSQTVRAVPSVRSEVTNISEHLITPVTVKRIIRLLLHYFLENDENQSYRFTHKDVEAIERLKNEKYANEEWIYNKSVLTFT